MPLIEGREPHRIHVATRPRPQPRRWWWWWIHPRWWTGLHAETGWDRLRWESYGCDGKERRTAQTCVRANETLSTWMQRNMGGEGYLPLACYVDKSAAKHYATSVVPWIRVPKTLAVYEGATIHELKAAILPTTYAFKSTHGSNLAVLVTNERVYFGNRGRLYKQQVLSRKRLLRLGRTFLRTCKQCKRERQYRHVRRAVLVEAFLGAGLPVGYKVHVMNGTVCALDVEEYQATSAIAGEYRMQVTRRRNPGGKTLTAEDANLRRIRMRDAPTTEALRRLFQAAVELSDGFRYARVDFYWRHDSWYFGELTFSPQAAKHTMDRWFGEPFLKKIGCCEAEEHGGLKTCTKH